VKRAALAWTAAVALLATLTVAMFYPLFAHLVHGGAPRWLEGDVAEEYWPDLVVLCRGLAHHHIPRWLPFEHGGTPFYADPQAGVYYPLNHAMCALAGPSPPIHWADARVVLHFLIAGIGMTLFLSREGIRLPAATLGGALFELSPYFRHNWELNLTWGFAWFPLVLLAASAMIRGPSMARGALLALAAALVVSVGSPPSTFFALLGATLFVIHGVVTSIRAGTPARKHAMALGAAAATAACVLPVMLLPTWELTKYSVQTAHDFATTSEGGMPLRDALGVFVPSLTDHHYVGALTLAFAPLAFVRPRAWRLRWFFLGLAICALLMIAGTHTPFYRAAYHLIPGVSLFRNPTRYSSLYGASMAALAAAGVDVLASNDLSNSARRVWAGVAMLAAFVAIGAGLTRPGAVLAAGIVISLALTRIRLAGKTWALAVALGGVACIDLFPWLVEARHTRPGPVAENRATEASLRALAPHLAYRTYDEFGIGMRSGSRYEQRDLRGYQDPLSMGRYQKMLGLLETKPALLGTFDVRWVLYGPHYAYGDWHHFIPDPARGTWAVLRAPQVWEIPGALPDAFWMDGATLVRDKDEALDRLAASAPAPAIVIERDDVRGDVASSSGAFAPAESTVSDESVSVSVDAPRSGWVLVNETYYPGWAATVDGAPAPIVRANAFVRAVAVGPGKHRIAMEFRPWQPRFLEPLALVALAAVAAGAAISRRRRETT
jgi:hypothetical protein